MKCFRKEIEKEDKDDGKDGSNRKNQKIHRKRVLQKPDIHVTL